MEEMIEEINIAAYSNETSNNFYHSKLNQLADYRRENKILRKRINELEGIIHDYMIRNDELEATINGLLDE